MDTLCANIKGAGIISVILAEKWQSQNIDRKLVSYAGLCYNGNDKTLEEYVCRLITSKRILLLQKIFVKMQHRKKIICGTIFYQNMRSDFKDKKP